MNVEELISHLGYDQSPAFVQGESLYRHPGFSYVFRKAQEDCGLHGVYTLRDRFGSNFIPLIYVCEAQDDREASLIHKRVWNQNVVPFLIVVAPRSVKVYPGFDYQDSEKALINLVKITSTTLSELDNFKSVAIDEGRIWDQWGRQVTPETRVDWKLLDQLDKLDKQLRELDGRNLDRHTAHALIGKYVYLRYLKDRDILSPRKLEEWHIREETVFGRNATLSGFLTVIDRLENWLNGSVFPLPEEHLETIQEEHIRKLASVFVGDDVDGQMHLDLRRYDFAHIPVETLSVVYQQFLHAEGKGREKSAYYTPIYLVNFMLDELEAKRPLESNMKVLDPACGSGAFLVQCYRRLIERRRMQIGNLRPTELRELLTEHIFGLDQDKDACQVAGLSLVLTLLDYINPPDLKHHSNFKIPILYGRNIIEGDFFKAGSLLSFHKFDWIVSNPPWRELKPKNLKPDDQAACDSMQKHRNEYPVGGYQLAEAFAWEVRKYVEDSSVVALLVPAMTLFKSESKAFRCRFFKYWDVWAVVNFANLAEVLFAGRSQIPAAALFYSFLKDDASHSAYITTYAPFLFNQEAYIKNFKSKRSLTWNIIVNSNELRQVEVAEAIKGHSLPWKIAMWGSVRDRQLLKQLTTRFPSLSDFLTQHRLWISQGPELRSGKSSDDVFVAGLIGKKKLNIDKLRRKGRIFFFPSYALETIDASKAYARKRAGVERPIRVCRPPHIIVDEARRFAVYSDEFLVVPARQIGIAGQLEQAQLLKALALFLSSDFATYYQFFYSAAWGVQKNLANKENLEQLPIPLVQLGTDDLKNWATLYDQLVQADREFQGNKHNNLFTNDKDGKRQSLLKRLNSMAFDLLEINATDRYLIEDLIYSRHRFLRGKLDRELMSPPDQPELDAYAHTLRCQLDDFLGDDFTERHQIEIYRDRYYGILSISLVEAESTDERVKIREAVQELSAELAQLNERLRYNYRQWIYFERNLTIFAGPKTYLLKPMQRLQWLRSQALIDADDLIADTLAAESA